MITLDQRLDGIFKLILSTYESAGGMSSASKGTERELVVSLLLKEVFPPHYRFSSGDIVDKDKRQTGQVDIVLENPIGYSFPAVQGGPRLFLAENVAAVIEVKSNLQNQWSEVLASSAKVAKLRRSFTSDLLAQALGQVITGKANTDKVEDVDKLKRDLLAAANDKKNIGNQRIPYYVVGFKGWKKDDTIVDKKLLDNRIDGILILESKKFFTKSGREAGSEKTEGNKSILAFLHSLELSFLEQTNRPPAFTQYF